MSKAEVAEIGSESDFDLEELEEGEIREINNGLNSHGGQKMGNLDEELPTGITFMRLPEDDESSNDEIMVKQISWIKQICSTRMKDLIQMQSTQLQDLKSLMKSEKLKIENSNQSHCDPNTDIHDRDERLNAFEKYYWCQRKKLVVRQIDARNKEKLLKDKWLEDACNGKLETSFDVPLPSAAFEPEPFIEACCKSETCCSDQQNSRDSLLQNEACQSAPGQETLGVEASASAENMVVEEGNTIVIDSDLESGDTAELETNCQSGPVDDQTLPSPVLAASPEVVACRTSDFNDPLVTHQDGNSEGLIAEPTTIQSEPYDFNNQPSSCLAQPFNITAPFPSQDYSTDPVEDEIRRIHEADDMIVKLHDKMKAILDSSLRLEKEKLTRKYNKLLGDTTTEFVEKRRCLQLAYYNVYRAKVLAENFNYTTMYPTSNAQPAAVAAATHQLQALLYGAESNHAMPVLPTAQSQFTARSAPALAPPVSSLYDRLGVSLTTQVPRNVATVGVDSSNPTTYAQIVGQRVTPTSNVRPPNTNINGPSTCFGRTKMPILRPTSVSQFAQRPLSGHTLGAVTAPTSEAQFNARPTTAAIRTFVPQANQQRIPSLTRNAVSTPNSAPQFGQTLSANQNRSNKINTSVTAYVPDLYANSSCTQPQATVGAPLLVSTLHAAEMYQEVQFSSGQPNSRPVQPPSSNSIPGSRRLPAPHLRGFNLPPPRPK